MKIFETNFLGKKLVVESGKLAQQANGSIILRYGDTTILATATASSEPKEGLDFFPLTVDYEERLYAVGKIPGGFIKREGRPSEKATLSARLIDRPIRPLFPDGFRHEVQVISTVLSVDQDNLPEISSINATSLALSISDIPFDGPIGAVEVALVNNNIVINPSSSEREKSDLSLTVAGNKEEIVMVEAGANEVSEELILEGIMKGHDEIKKVIEFQEKIVNEIGKTKMEFVFEDVDEEIKNYVSSICQDNIKNAIVNSDKTKREEGINKVVNDTLSKASEIYPEREKDIEKVIKSIIKLEARNMILNEGVRPDGRKHDEIREITCEISILPKTHGSGLFTRGQTQALTIATLGAMGDVQILDGLSIEESKRYMHHYNFPPYSVGETRFLRGPGRREIGHGSLAEKALELMIPSEEDFPYTIRLVSEILSSNGSTSMASVCGSTLALLDAGVPIKSPVAGIAMGLVKENEKIAILSDIQGMEDFLGDMDFKVAGTENGITAIQMDMKIKGLSKDILKSALDKANIGRLYILEKMNAVISKPKAELSPYAPRIISLKIDPEKIRNIIGPGGKTINKIISDTGAKIDIEDDGRVFITSLNKDSGTLAKTMIEDLIKEVKVGEIYVGKVQRITNFGAFIEILPGKEGLVHISKIDKNRVKKVEDVLSLGDEVLVKVTEIDNQGRINLSRKDAMQDKDEKTKK